MTKEITKAFILQEIQDKFKLREFEPGKFLFGETVVPIYNIEQHLLKWTRETVTLSITSNDNFLFFTVPENEQWLLRAYQSTFLGSGAHSVIGTLVGRPSISQSIYLDLTPSGSPATATYLVTLPTPVVLHPLHKLYIQTDDYVSSQNHRLDIDVMKETLR